ncbi:glycosyltransferase [soil metagenome]
MSEQVSVIIPVGQRYDEVVPLYEAYKDALAETGRPFEIIYVLDGRLPKVFDELRSLQARGERIRIVKLAKSFGEATALTAGFEHSHGELLLTLPAYHQIEPPALGELLDQLDGYDMVIARRWPRAGSRFETIRRELFHGMIRSVTGMRYRDLGCGVRAFRRVVVDEVPIYGDQHRFLPLLANRRGFRILELDVAQSPQDRFRGGYRTREYLHRVLDIFTVFFLVRFTKKPLRFFGMLGSIMALAGLVVLAVIIIQRMFFDVGLGNRPVLLLSSLMIMLGVQIFALGLIGELIIFTHAKDLKEYTVELIVNGEAEAEPRKSVEAAQQPAAMRAAQS